MTEDYTWNLVKFTDGFNTGSWSVKSIQVTLKLNHWDGTQRTGERSTVCSFHMGRGISCGGQGFWSITLWEGLICAQAGWDGHGSGKNWGRNNLWYCCQLLLWPSFFLFLLSIFSLFFFPSSSSSSCTFNIVPRVWSLVREDPLELEMAINTSILACRIPWAEEPGGIQSMRSQRVRRDWARSSTEEVYQLAWFYVSAFCNRPNLYLQTINEEFLFPSAQCLGNISPSFRSGKSHSGFNIFFQGGLGADYLMSLNIDFLSCKMEIKFVLLTLADL